MKQIKIGGIHPIRDHRESNERRNVSMSCEIQTFAEEERQSVCEVL